MNIKFVDLFEQYISIKDEIDTAIRSVLEYTQFIRGPEVKKFEEEFAAYTGIKNCTGVNSGSDALSLGIQALSLPANAEIIVPANTFISTAFAVSHNGLRPVFVDIDEHDHGINLEDLQRKINPRTAAVIVVHLYGQADKVKDIQEIIRKSGQKIYLIEDACQAHGAFYSGKRAGGFGIFSAFSFYPGKNLGAYGDGGMLATNNTSLAKKAKLLREYGQNKKYHHEIIGTNSRLDTIQAAVLRVKLKYLDTWIRKRQENAAYYSELLKKEVPAIKIPHEFTDRKSTYHLYVIRVKQRNKLLKYLSKQGIQAQIHYPIPLHLQKAYAHLGYKKGDFPIAEKISSEILSLPIYPELQKEQIEYIVRTIKNFYNETL